MLVIIDSFKMHTSIIQVHESAITRNIDSERKRSAREDSGHTISCQRGQYLGLNPPLVFLRRPRDGRNSILQREIALFELLSKRRSRFGALVGDRNDILDPPTSLFAKTRCG